LEMLKSSYQKKIDEMRFVLQQSNVARRNPNDPLPF